MLSSNGTRLGEKFSSVFGEFVDYARHLGFNEPIDYKRFRTVFKKLRHSKVETKRDVSPDKIIMIVGPEYDLIVSLLTDLKPVIAIDREFPAAGDLVLVQIDMPTSVEGDTLRKDNSSYLPNPSLSGESWRAPFRPAIVLKRKVNEGVCHSFWLIPLTNPTPDGALSLKEFGVDYLPDSLSNLSAYVFPRAIIEIYSLSSQVLLLKIFFQHIRILIVKPM